MISILQSNPNQQGLSFDLPLSDAGAGAVNTTPISSLGSGTPTFTRATVKWTKLASGLWTQVGTGVAASCYIGASTAVGAYGGYFAEGAGTQLVTPDASIRDMTDASWVKGVTMTAAKTATGIDGAANACTTLTGGAVSATNTAFQTLTAAASSRTYSCWIKRRTGTGTINITQDGGSTYTDVTSLINASTFTRVSLTASVLNAAFGIQVVTLSDAIDVDFNQFEAGAFATSPMATAGAARNADVLTYPLASNANPSLGSIYAEVNSSANSPFTTTNVVVGYDASGGPFAVEAGAAVTIISSNDGATTVQKNFGNSLLTAVRKVALSYGGSARSITGDGAAVATGSFDGSFGSTAIAIGCGTGGANQWYGTLRNVRLYNRALSDAQLQQMTT